MEPIRAILIGAGERGMGVYAPYAQRHPEELTFVAVAEPDAYKRSHFCEQYGIALENSAADYHELLQRPKFADAVLVCTQDQMHTQPAVMAMQAGYHVLLEKPMATTEKECRLLVEESEKTGRVLMVCHVLRYTAFFTALKKLLDSGRLGRLMTVQHTEQIANWHFAHSFVRGNWGNSEQSAPLILAKCCHDLDLIHWLVGGQCKRLDSVGGLSYFSEQNAPMDAPERCTDGCSARDRCPYYAPALYLTENTQWPTSAISPDTSFAARSNALHTGPYGRCVYHCDNNVCDHQTVQLWFDNEVAVTLTATAFTQRMNRVMALTCTNGEITGNFEDGEIHYHTFDDNQTHTIQLNVGGDILGHGGGDDHLMADFVAAVQGDVVALTTAQGSLQSHLWAFAAEESRKGHSILF